MADDTSSNAGDDPCAAGRSALERGDYATALQVFQPLAAQGIADAQFGLGLLYDRGQGIARDAALAVQWYRRAAEQGHVTAQLNLGASLYAGDGVPQDHAQAVRWFRAAAEQGHADAQSNLGVAFAEGKGVDQDLTTAASWFLLAAEQGNAQAQFHLGGVYLAGLGGPQRTVDALKWLRLAAQQGLATAQASIGMCYHQGLGVNQDHAAAARWYRDGAEQGNAAAAHGLGYLYSQGLGVKQDPLEATRWFRLAAVQGHAGGQYCLGQCYASGTGVAQDLPTALMWLRLAADQGYGSARYALGNMYFKGSGVFKDDVTADRWMRLAAESGHPEARRWLDARHAGDAAAPRGDAPPAREKQRWEAAYMKTRADPSNWSHRMWVSALEKKWDDLAGGLSGLEPYVNDCCPLDDTQDTFLHLAARGGAPVDVVRRMIALGAWRSIRNASNERAIDTARSGGNAHLADLLEPQFKRQTSLPVLLQVQARFHQLIRWRSGPEAGHILLRLPQLEPLLESDDAAFWFWTPAWSGGFDFHLVVDAGQPRLIVNSGIFQRAQPALRHEITPDGIRLLAIPPV